MGRPVYPPGLVPSGVQVFLALPRKVAEAVQRRLARPDDVPPTARSSRLTSGRQRMDHANLTRESSMHDQRPRCRSCGNADLKLVLSLGKMPLANALLAVD